MDQLEFTLPEMQAITADILKNVVRICEDENLPYYAIYGTLIGAIRHHGPIPWDYDVDLCVPENQIDHFVKVMERRLPSKYWINYRNYANKPQKFPRIGLKGYETDKLHVDIFRWAAIPDDDIEAKKLISKGVFWSKVWKAKITDADYYYKDKKKRLLAKILKIISLPVSMKAVVKKMDEVSQRCSYGTTEYVGNPFFEGNQYPLSWFDGSELVPYMDFFIRVPLGYDSILTHTYGDYMTPPDQTMTEKRIHNNIYVVRPLK